jgi:hypothetical protein
MDVWYNELVKSIAECIYLYSDRFITLAENLNDKVYLCYIISKVSPL